MAFERLNYEKVWTRAEDFPAYESDETQVRADLQYHPDAVKEFINALLTTLEAEGAAGELGAVNADGAASSIQSVLDDHKEALAQLRRDIVDMVVPATIRSSAVSFEADSWATVGGAVTLTIPRSDHGRENASFGYSLYQKVGGAYKSGTWGAAATRVSYNSGGSITLTADEAYSGKIVFFGL